MEQTILLKDKYWGFPVGSVVKNPPASVGDTGSIPGPGRSHMSQSNQGRAPQLLSLCSATRGHCDEKPAQCNWRVAPALHS